MKVIIGSDLDGFELKEYIKKEINKYKEFEIYDVTDNGAKNFIESSKKIINEIEKDSDSLGIAIDAYGVGSFITTTKHPGIVAAEVSDERSAYMTREHNNSRIITMGSQIVGRKLAENIVLAFLRASYEGGRHQIRVDMLNKMC